MDPLTQGFLGAAPAALFAAKPKVKAAIWVGALAGMAPDLDVFIRSAADPLLALEYHRHFTHALAFIPFGAAICALVFWVFLKKQFKFSEIYLWALLGYATHGLLDACTSYGTQLYWPFNRTRVEWNIIGIVDPLFTGALVLAVSWAVLGAGFKKTKRVSWAFTAFAMFYLVGLGTLQRERGERLLAETAAARGHTIDRLEVKPTVGNLILWRGIYETQGQFFVDALHLGWNTKVYTGSSIAKIVGTPAGIDPDSVVGRDVERFRWFSADYLAWHPENPNVIGDLRFSLLANSLSPLWGIQVEASRQTEHTPYVTTRGIKPGQWNQFWSMIKGEEIL